MVEQASPWGESFHDLAQQVRVGYYHLGRESSTFLGAFLTFTLSSREEATGQLMEGTGHASYDWWSTSLVWGEGFRWAGERKEGLQVSPVRPASLRFPKVIDRDD